MRLVRLIALFLALPAAYSQSHARCPDCQLAPASVSRLGELRIALSELTQELEVLEGSLVNSPDESFADRDSNSARTSIEPICRQTLEEHMKQRPFARRPVATISVGIVLVAIVAAIPSLTWRTNEITAPDGELGDDYTLARFRMSYPLHMFIFAVMLFCAATHLFLTHMLWSTLLVVLHVGAIYLRWLAHYIHPSQAPWHRERLDKYSNRKTQTRLERPRMPCSSLSIATRRAALPNAKSLPIPLRQCLRYSATRSTWAPRRITRAWVHSRWACRFSLRFCSLSTPMGLR